MAARIESSKPGTKMVAARVDGWDYLLHSNYPGFDCDSLASCLERT